MVAHGVGLHAVVHETLGAEEFKPFFKGDVYYDPKVRKWLSFTFSLHMHLERFEIHYNLIISYN